jgi:hypothetical protein
MAEDVRSLSRLIARLRIDARLTELAGKVFDLAQALAKVNAKDQRAATTVSNIVVGATDVTVTWPQSWPDQLYIVIPTLITGAAATGLLFASLKPGTRTENDCVVTLVNRSAATIASAGLDVLGVRT